MFFIFVYPINITEFNSWVVKLYSINYLSIYLLACVTVDEEAIFAHKNARAYTRS